MIRPATLARDDQVLAALRSCDAMATTSEVAAALAGCHPNALYSSTYTSLWRLEAAGLITRRRFQHNANTYWQPLAGPYDLSSLDWSEAGEGDV